MVRRRNGRRSNGASVMGELIQITHNFGGNMRQPIRSHEELEVYQIAFNAAMEIFEVTKSFPKEERYSLTDQIRRSSRSVCAQISEAWRKRRYVAAFISKLNDAEAEAAESQVWLRFSLECKYLDENRRKKLHAIYDQVIGKLVTMINNPEPWTAIRRG